MIVRSGLIPYTKINNVIYFILFVDAGYGTIIDGGGHVEYRERHHKTAVREMYEESLGLIIENSDEIIRKSIIIHDNHTKYFVYDIGYIDLEEICYNFRNRYLDCISGDSCHPNTTENSYMIYISKNDLIDICNGKLVSMPKNLKKLLKKNITEPYKNKDLNYVNEFLSGLNDYPDIYPKLREIFFKLTDLEI